MLEFTPELDENELDFNEQDEYNAEIQAEIANARMRGE